ncbi:L,D-transpeptidase family protein [Altererythrobacter soli]|uniref:L,D-transpeptidase family protein n=1 Tax=Croceibacterium soli TaxID=1739690 RepID=A0A6I4UQC2_9SPHN|nr:L,D-transpeptidase family protein [Croceibacterium soli]MXP40636.1 L,D-transpeptidase family protein [Croceibacterium soli]
MIIFARILPLPAAAVLALAGPAFAQQRATPENQLFDKVLPQKVLEEDAVEVVSTPTVQPLNVQQPRYPEVQPWSVADAQQLLAVVEGIGAEGLDPRDYRPAELRQAIARGPSPQLDQLASETFVWLVEDLRDGRTPMEARKQWFVVDPDPDLLPTGELLAKALAGRNVAATLASLAPTHPDYAALKAELARTPASQAKQRAMIRANMDRWRWLARDLGGQYLITNVPEYQLRLTVNDKIIRTYKTIVGKPGRTATPQLAETVEGVIFNPTWTVPQSIVKGEGLGAKVLNNPGWARSAGYKATKAADGNVYVVQQPGPTNSLGMMKLDMPNPHAIFLHDTPARNLFNTENRALSHGCIRTERALELAMTIAILGQGATKDEAVAISTSGEYTRVPVVKTMPVYITYFTMGRDIEGNLRTFNDIYGRDAPVLASFNAPRVGNRARVTSEEAVEIIDDLQTS